MGSDFMIVLSSSHGLVKHLLAFPLNTSPRADPKATHIIVSILRKYFHYTAKQSIQSRGFTATLSSSKTILPFSDQAKLTIHSYIDPRSIFF